MPNDLPLLDTGYTDYTGTSYSWGDSVNAKDGNIQNIQQAAYVPLMSWYSATCISSSWLYVSGRGKQLDL